MTDTISRFSRTVENYLRYRPRFPMALVDFLQTEIRLTDDAAIADIGSGTGFVAEVFLKRGYGVTGIEPNADMRRAAQQLLKDYPRFKSIEATAEATTLEPCSIDLITAGQAFQFFDQEKARGEFARILRPGGWVALLRFIPRQDTPFLAAFDALWKKYLDPKGHGGSGERDDELRAWYAPGKAGFQSFDTTQFVDLEGLRGRVLAASKAPTPEQPQYPAMLEEIEALFQKHQLQGQVAIEYQCRMCYGQFS